MRILYYPLQRLNARFEPQLSQAVADVVRSGHYLRGEQTAAFEHTFAEYIGTKHAVACANGLDALTLALMAWKQRYNWADNDEVVIPALTFAATGLAAVRAGLKPVWAEVGNDALIDCDKLQTSISPRTRVVIAVHLYGRVCDMEALHNLQERHHFLLLEDAAQAHGAKYGEQFAGSFGNAAAFSFYPGKNLGALGDAGMLVTQDSELADAVRTWANYGAQEKYRHEMAGINSRMDELQAAALAVKLPMLDADNARRIEIAADYRHKICHPDVFFLPEEEKGCSVHHIFPVFCAQKSRLQAHLRQCGIETLCHYPLPLHRQPAFASFSASSLPVAERLTQTELSLPIHPLLTDAEIDYICQCVNAAELND